MSITARRAAAAVLLGAAVLQSASCRTGPPDRSLRGWTDDFELRVVADPSPPIAREKTRYKIVVHDKQTRQPIEGGEGRIFASTREGGSTWDGLAAGPELGTYYGTLTYVTAGEWAVAIQFRRDSTKRLERMDWMQEVHNPK